MKNLDYIQIALVSTTILLALLILKSCTINMPPNEYSADMKNCLKTYAPAECRCAFTKKSDVIKKCDYSVKPKIK